MMAAASASDGDREVAVGKKSGLRGGRGETGRPILRCIGWEKYFILMILKKTKNYIYAPLNLNYKNNKFVSKSHIFRTFKNSN